MAELISKKEESGDSTLWSFLFTTFFTGMTAFFIYTLYQEGLIFRISFLEMVILVLAIFRLTRLVVYDSIAQFMRDIVIDKTRKWDAKKGLYVVSRFKPKKGLRRKLYELIACPWCFGVWASVISLFVYLMWPVTFFIFVFLAIAGVSTLIQLTANLLGWHAEGKKLEVQAKEK